MKTKLKFGDNIDFNEIFGNVLYLENPKKKDFIERKIYNGDFDPMEIVQGKIDGYSGKVKFPSCIRKIQFLKCVGSGIIIGQTTKQEGIYVSGWYDRLEQEGEPPMLKIKKVYSFWKVATKMNEIMLVPKTVEK